MAGKTATIGLVGLALAVLAVGGYVVGALSSGAAAILVGVAMALNVIWFLGVLIEGVRDERR